MKTSKALKVYCLVGLLLCATAGGIIGFFFEKESSLSPDDAFSTVLLIGSILLCILILKDVKDRRGTVAKTPQKRKFHELISSQFKLIGQELHSPTTRSGMFAYFLWATSQYTMLILFADFQVKYSYTVIMMMFGYLLGVAILGFCKQVSDEKMIKAGFLLTIASFGFFFIMNFFVEDKTVITAISCFFYTLGNAFLSPTILSLFSRERAVHEQGKGFGLIVSTDGCGFLVGSIIVIIINHLSIKIEYVFLISFIIFLISWMPYRKYEKTRKNATRKLSIQA